MYETVLERFRRWVFGEFYRSAKYVRTFPRSTTGAHTRCLCSRLLLYSQRRTQTPSVAQKTAFEVKGRLYTTGKVIQRLFIVDLYT